MAVRDPRQGGRLLVKRVTSVAPDGVTIVGDNAAASTDSRHFGAVPARAVVGTVVWRYGPPHRRGPVR